MTLEGAEITAAVGEERLRVADLAARLGPDEWSVQSLCDAWTVRDVVAHLTVTTRLTVPKVAWAALKARGSFDRMEEALAAERVSRYSETELVAQLRESAASSKRFPGSTPMDPLMDLVIHGQDIARPLGREHISPPDVVAASLAYVAANKFMGGPKRLAGLHLAATDADWSTGEGPDVTGPAIDLLMVASGRPAGLESLAGDGVVTLRERLTR